jgi:hypothetical protein
VADGIENHTQATRAFDESRIERIENAVDAIAIEVERISEAQRFTGACSRSGCLLDRGSAA